LGKKQKALEYYNQSLPIWRAVRDRSGEATTLNNTGRVYDTLGENQKALEYFNQALPIYRSIGDRSGEATTLNNIGLVYNSLGEKQKALKYFNQALPIFRAVGDRSSEARALNNIGLSHSGLGERQKALEYYNQALPIWRAVGDRSGEAIALNNIGGVYTRLDEKQKALEYYNQSLPILRAVGDRSGEATTLSNIGVLFERQNQTNVAIAFYKKSISIYETLRQDIKALSRSQQSTYTQTVSGTYRELANLLIQKNRLSEAQQVIELLKIGELKEIEPDKFKFNTPIRQLPISDSEKQEIAKINPEIAKEIQTEPLPKLDQLSLSNPLNQSAQALTKPNSALIYQLITADKLWIILITPDGKLQRFASSQTKAQLETLTQSIRSQLEKCERSTCTSTDTQTLNQTTQTLYEQLFPADLKTALAQTKHLTFALDGSLRNIPIAALHTGQQYLIEKYTLSSIIAAQLTDSQDKIPSNAQDAPILALGTSQSARLEVPDFIKADRQDRFAALGNVPIELNAILRSDRNPKAFPGKQLLNDQFTLPNIQQQLPNHRILHIASHGIFRPNSLDYSYILLGNQKRWSIAALDQDAQLFQNLHLITLSACQTGLSDRDKNGMEIAGMSHAFLSKGAKAINASLWSIDDASTAILMQQFYQNLTQNQSKAQALQSAQLHLLRTPRSQLITELSRSTDTRWTFESPNTPTPSTPVKTRDYSHPYYWAAFTLIGNSL
jgi:CHAT domain-containing protein